MDKGIPLLPRKNHNKTSTNQSKMTHSYETVTPRVPPQYSGTESHQYEPDESEVWWHHQLQRHFEDKGHWWTFARKSTFLRWSLTFITGVILGICAYFVIRFTETLLSFKLETFHALIEKEKSGDISTGVACIFLLTCNLLFASCAWLMVYTEPLSAGSGIPEVKCYLNGLNIPRLVRVKTLLCKAIGVVFSASSGLPLGKEGPMIHVGSVVAAGISQGKTVTFGLNTSFSKYQDFRNDREKRDFVACGAASGVAAAFGAPIGGCLFSLEEGASFWSTKLTWRCFFCAMTTVTTLYAINTAGSLFGPSDIAAMFSFGEFFNLREQQTNYSVWELILFVLIGSFGGLIGAAFNNSNYQLYLWRSKNITHPNTKLLEVLAVAGTVTLVSIFLPILWSKCTPLPVDMSGWSEQEKELVTELIPLYCPADTHYNELASLYLTNGDMMIRQLFHFRETGNHDQATFSSSALFLFFLPYISLACLTYGIAVPSGMFAPSLISGAAFGRLLGHLLHRLDGTHGTFADAGTYALMGAAAITGGITRMTISLTVIILEATGDMQYVLPLMLTVMSARLIGNIYNEGLYDIHIHARHLPYLEEDENISQLVDLHDLTVSEVMTSNPITMKSVMRVGEIYDILRSVKHHCFPVVEDGVLAGTITRKVMCTLMKHKAFGPASSDPNTSSRISPLVNWATLEIVYPHYPTIDQIKITEYERMQWLDLRPYLDSSAYTIGNHTSIQRTYRMFRTLGLRHLCVVSKHNVVLGIVTRADLASAHELADSKSAISIRRNKKKEGKQDFLQHTINIDLQDGKSLDEFLR